MNQKLLDTVVNAVLYEGYILYPHRASKKKNRQHFIIGRVYPEAYCVAHNGIEPCSMQTQCLIQGGSRAPLNITVRFLHPMARDIGALAAPMRTMPALDNPDFFHVVPELEIDGTHYSSWQEAVEQPFILPTLTVTELCEEPNRSVPFSFPPFRSIEPIMDAREHIAGVMVRRQEALDGEVELSGERLDEKAWKITVRIGNKTPIPAEDMDDATEIVMRTFASTHTILHAPSAEFVSLIDPPSAYAAAAGGCRNMGTWPVLIGDEAKKERNTMISSPIILYDYPKIAPENTYDLSDSTPSAPILEENGSDKDIDIMRAVRSFDPCLPRGVHLSPEVEKTLKLRQKTPALMGWPKNKNEASPIAI